MSMKRFLEEATIVSAFVPVDMQTGANDGDFVSMADYDRCLVLLHKGIGTAGDDPVFTLRQATDNAGTGAKALDFEVIFSKVGTQSSTNDFTVTTQAAANTFTDATSAEAEAIIAVEVKASSLDVDNNFDHIQLQIPDVGANAQLGGGLYVMYNSRYPQATAPSVI